MGSSDEGKSSKSDKSSSPAPPDQTNIHVYPDWAAMQAYYSPRVPMPPYYNSAVASGHAPPPYMWGPTQAIMPPYGTPYAAIYPHGGVYVHPTVPMGSHGHGVPSSPKAAPETPTKSSGNTNGGLMKKLKGFDGLAMSIGNSTAENAESGAEPRPSQSAETEGSIDDSDGNTTGADQTRRKRVREGTPPIAGVEGNNEARSKPVAAREATATISPKVVGSVLPPGMTTSLELSNPPAKSSPTNVPRVMPSEIWLQKERELKRERRKQSNRESARRSRLRKQAETEELARKVESLTAENTTLRSEINQLTEKSEKLRLENATLVEGLKNGELGYAKDIIMNKKADKEGEMYEKKSNSGAKLHQLFDPSPRADAVAAS
ncbi:G-box-binding factor 3-like isoform X1 [Gossypium arboreum]|uniref:G-box-binding factor 3-like isoform X1 n=1 Tax=Gossypium arboreum TaxID=29729 RepID=UPI0008195C55|nr:G-box-binding factor 3-like isoform X1 [Gossypium arboreum]XP_017635171.1 G-box-binding factor 3-like isoform X1 [Gossypium arboreum]XP_052879609.1 G-box-binding factor 3-like isoform X1 [Gossypium arboreum]